MSLYDVLEPSRAQIWLNLRNEYTSAGLRVVPNSGGATGAPATVRVGNGTTAITFPRQIVPRGRVFAGAQYLLDATAANWTADFSLTVLLRTNRGYGG
jgi:hypothetical protein